MHQCYLALVLEAPASRCHRSESVSGACSNTGRRAAGEVSGSPESLTWPPARAALPARRAHSVPATVLRSTFAQRTAAFWFTTLNRNAPSPFGSTPLVRLPQRGLRSNGEPPPEYVMRYLFAVAPHSHLYRPDPALFTSSISVRVSDKRQPRE